VFHTHKSYFHYLTKIEKEKYRGLEREKTKMKRNKERKKEKREKEWRRREREEG